MPMPAKNVPHAPCEWCGRAISRKRYGAQLEDIARFRQRRFCGAPCFAASSRKEGASRGALLRRIKKLRGTQCEACGRTDKLSMHHKDRDWRNNDPLNLQTLCSSCHTQLHHAAGDIAKKKPVRTCSVCMAPCDKGEWCGKHRQRARKYGDPMLTKIRAGKGFAVVRMP